MTFTLHPMDALWSHTPPLGVSRTNWAKGHFINLVYCHSVAIFTPPSIYYRHLRYEAARCGWTAGRIVHCLRLSTQPGSEAPCGGLVLSPKQTVSPLGEPTSSWCGLQSLITWLIKLTVVEGRPQEEAYCAGEAAAFRASSDTQQFEY